MKVRVSILLILTVVSLAARKNKAVERCDNAARVLDEIMGAKDSAIPQDLLGKAQCVAIIPGVKKAGLGFGGKYGKGVLNCRGKGNKGWTGPSTVRIEGGSFGLQIGGSSTDVVLLVMNERGAEKAHSKQVHFRSGRRSGRRAGGTDRNRSDGCPDARRDSVLFQIARCLCRRFTGGCHAAARP